MQSAFHNLFQWLILIILFTDDKMMLKVPFIQVYSARKWKSWDSHPGKLTAGQSLDTPTTQMSALPALKVKASCSPAPSQSAFHNLKIPSGSLLWKSPFPKAFLEATASPHSPLQSAHSRERVPDELGQEEEDENLQICRGRHSTRHFTPLFREEGWRGQSILKRDCAVQGKPLLWVALTDIGLKHSKG